MKQINEKLLKIFEGCVFKPSPVPTWEELIQRANERFGEQQTQHLISIMFGYYSRHPNFCVERGIDWHVRFSLDREINLYDLNH